MSNLFYKPSDIKDDEYSDDEKALISLSPYYDTLCDNINESLRGMINNNLEQVEVCSMRKNDARMDLLIKILSCDGWSGYKGDGELYTNMGSIEYTLYIKNPFYKS